MNKKGIMGIGTLIIFIATILVAAVAAGVIISTSGILQQQSLLIADQSQSRLVDGIQITHVFMRGDVVNRTANNVEMLIRPEPASRPINFQTTSISFFTATNAYSASLSHPTMIDFEFTLTTSLDTTWQAFADLDGDGVADEIRLVDQGAGNPDFLQVNLSRHGASALLPLGFDTSVAGQSISREDIPIRFADGRIYGYIHLSDASTAAGSLNPNTVTITDEIRGPCSFETLRPETRYCISTVVGTDDGYLEYGETVFIYFSMLQPLLENDQWEVIIFPQDGRSTFVLGRVPSVVYQQRMTVFP